MHFLPDYVHNFKVLTIPTLLVADSAAQIVSETSHPALRSPFIAVVLVQEHCEHCTNAYAHTLPIQM